MTRIFLIFVLLAFQTALFANSYPINPWNLSIQERIINRKHISHIVIEAAADSYLVTLLVCDRFPYNYKAQSYPLSIATTSAREADQLVAKLDAYLKTGQNLYIKINGKRIVRYRFLKSSH